MELELELQGKARALKEIGGLQASIEYSALSYLMVMKKKHNIIP